jgi:hypothetical protein
MSNKSITLTLAALGLLALGGCDRNDDHPAERAADAIEDGADDTADAIRDSADENH